MRGSCPLTRTSFRSPPASIRYLTDLHGVEGCGIVRPVMSPRGPLSARRMSAHWVVIAAAALTTLVAAAVGAALAVFAGQALPQAVQHDLVNAPGNSLAAAGPFGTGDAQSTSAALKTAIGGALPGVPFDFYA